MDITEIHKSNLSLLKGSSAKELLKAKPLKYQIKEFGFEQPFNHVRIGVLKCLRAMGVSWALNNSKNVVNELVQDIVDEIIDMYPYESIEDILLVLRKGRRGEYDTSYGKHNKFSVPLFREWMTCYLEEKAQAREKQHHQNKYDNIKIEQENFGKIYERMKESNIEDQQKEKSNKLEIARINNKIVKEGLKRKHEQLKKLQHQLKWLTKEEKEDFGDDYQEAIDYLKMQLNIKD